MRCFTPAVLIASLSISIAFADQPAPRVAVWDPVGGTREAPNRFRLLPERLDSAAEWMREGGCVVERVNADRLNDASAFSVERFDALLMPGDTFPKDALSSLQRFADSGGILIALDSLVPFLVRIERTEDGSWKLSPSSPPFAWQTHDLMLHFGLRYIWKPELHDSGMVHTLSPLMRHYLPETVPGEALRFRARGRWLAAETDATFYPLIASHRTDGADVVPAIFAARRGRATAILCTVSAFTEPPDNGRPWPHGPETVVAMARLAADLRHGRINLADHKGIQLAESIPPPEPLQTREVRGSVDPEGTRALTRWGNFDGIGIELGPIVKRDGMVEVQSDTVAAGVPRGLAPRGRMRLHLPSKQNGAHFLRVRGAYNQGGAGLRVSTGNTVLWHEHFSYIDAEGESNFGQLARGEAIEFNRVVFVPPEEGQVLELSNTGESPVYFDAIQIEQHTGQGREYIVGLGVFDAPPLPIPSEVSRAWPAIRASLRFERVGEPGEANRWKGQEELVSFYTGICSRVHAIIQNTPGWAAISEERLAEASKGYRARDVAPDPQKFAGMVEYFLQHHGQSIEALELWNEPELRQFFWGTREEAIALFQATAPLIRRLRPDVRIIGPGLAGHDIAGWLRAIQDAALFDYIDWPAIHCYAGKTPAWDRIAGKFQGELYALGIDKPIYANEQGFPWHNGQWFTPPPFYTPWLQGVYMNTGLARLLSGGIEKVNIFMAFNWHDGLFDLFDPKGRPRLAYSAVEDYMKLCRDGGRRLDVSLASPDGSPLAGTYVAAATHSDGSVTLVLNPAEVERLHPPKIARDYSTEFDERDTWSWFQGKATFEGGKAVLTVGAGKPYMGFHSPTMIDLDQRPILEVVVPECESTWSLGLKLGSQEVALASGEGAGTKRIDLRDAAGNAGVVDAALTFRMTGRTVLDALRFLPPAAAGPAKAIETFTADSGGHSFFGRAAFSDGGLRLTPDEGKAYVGYNNDVRVEPARRPFLEIDVPACEKAWNLSIRVGEEQTMLVEDAAAGRVRIDLREKLPHAPAIGTLTLRAFGATTVGPVRLLPDLTAKAAIAATEPAAQKETVPASDPLPVLVRFPLPSATAQTPARATCRGRDVPVSVTANGQGALAWIECRLDLPGRTVLVLKR